MTAAGAAGWVVLVATSTPTPNPADPESVSPGLWGFFVVFVLAIVVWLLMRNMTQRLRRLRFREQQRLEHERDAGGADGGLGENPRDRPDDDLPRAPR